MKTIEKFKPVVLITQQDTSMFQGLHKTSEELRLFEQYKPYLYGNVTIDDTAKLAYANRIRMLNETSKDNKLLQQYTPRK